MKRKLKVKKVFLLTEGDYDDYKVIGVLTNRRAADKAVKIQEKRRYSAGSVHVENYFIANSATELFKAIRAEEAAIYRKYQQKKRRKRTAVMKRIKPIRPEDRWE